MTTTRPVNSISRDLLVTISSSTLRSLKWAPAASLSSVSCALICALEDGFDTSPALLDAHEREAHEQQATAKALKPNGKYVIAILPPDVPGKLHIGHALALALEDTLAVVEKQLTRHPKDGKSQRQDFSREDFIQLCQEWKEDYHQAINKTIRRLGISVDWSREAFTMSSQLSQAVAETFVQLHSEGLIYRANKLVHWSCRLATALSTIEVDQKELDGSAKLDVPGYDRRIEFGTLTPETMLGDTGVAVHPQGDRYKDLVGKTARHPIIPGRKLIMIVDDSVDRECGIGAVKLTPAHDHNDFTLGKKHGLPFINILNEDGTLNNNAGPYAGEKRFNARYGVIEELKKLGFYTRQESNKMWMKMELWTKPAIAVVESGELTIRLEMQKRQYLQWMRNLQDGCLSRQLWWGHQIPAYFISIEGEEGGGNDADNDYWVSGRTGREAQEKAEQKFSSKKVTLRQDEDVLDYLVQRWALAVQYPGLDKTSDRKLLSEYDYGDRVPFTDVYCHGLICESDGRKMSESLGNVIDPIDILDGISLDALHQKLLQGNLAQSEVKNAERYQKKAFPQGIPEVGADALRFSLINYAQSSGDDIKCTASENFATRSIRPRSMSLESLAMISFLLIILHGTPEEARSAMDTLYTTLETGLRLVSPFMPFLTDELWQRLPRRPGDNTSSITIAEYPKYDPSLHDPASEVAWELVLGCSRGIRSLLADYAVKDKGVVHIVLLNQISLRTSSFLAVQFFLFPLTPTFYLQVKGYIQDAAKEVERIKAKVDEARREQVDIDAIQAELNKVQDKDVTDATQSAKGRKRNVEARLKALQQTVLMFDGCDPAC
ncbi:hypothetical protein B7494_g6418 [Chlorociboria aeruginascens]|nr:hypothetical protein B7494_g6418 [Chlorociboria aeruginascens]